MTHEEIELEFKSLKHHVECLICAEDKLNELSYILSGNALKSPSIKSTEEAKFQKGTVIYKNNLIELMTEEETLIKVRDYHLFAVRKVMYYLQQLTDEEVELLELRYWHRIDIKHISKMYYCSRSAIYRKFDVIFEKLGQCPPKNML